MKIIIILLVLLLSGCVASTREQRYYDLFQKSHKTDKEWAEQDQLAKYFEQQGKDSFAKSPYWIDEKNENEEKSVLFTSRNLRLSTTFDAYEFDVENTRAGYDQTSQINHNFDGRKYKVEHENSQILIPSFFMLYSFNNGLSIGLKYGDNKIAFNSGNENATTDSRIFNNDSSRILMLFSSFYNFEVSFLNLTFTNGTLRLFDVSTDPEGENGTLEKNVPYVSKLNEMTIRYKGWKDVRFLKYTDPIIVIGRYEYPTIPYEFKTTGTGTNLNYVSEGPLQNVALQSIFAGTHYKQHFFELGLYLGDIRYKFKDANGKEIDEGGMNFSYTLGLFYEHLFNTDFGPLEFKIGLNRITYGSKSSSKDENAGARTEYELDGNLSVLKAYLNLSIYL